MAAMSGSPFLGVTMFDLVYKQNDKKIGTQTYVNSIPDSFYSMMEYYQILL